MYFANASRYPKYPNIEIGISFFERSYIPVGEPIIQINLSPLYLPIYHKLHKNMQLWQLPLYYVTVGTDLLWQQTAATEAYCVFMGYVPFLLLAFNFYT